MREPTSSAAPGTSLNELDGDRPKQHLSEDRLGYAAFSRALAHAVHDMVPKDGIVLAINGPWGSGKTSAVNMALEALRKLQEGADESRRIEVVYFNPWWFSAQEDLVRAFFHDVAATLEQTSISKRVVEGLKAVGRRAAGAKDLVLAGLEFVPGGLVVKGLAGSALDAAGKVSSNSKSLAAERAALSDALQAQSRRILVVIDDIDRLPPDEARQIFRMVKSVADLPNVIYLLVFDRAVAREATGAGAGENGPDWLDKIVQAAFDLPPVQPANLLDLFVRDLERLAQPAPRLDQVRWGNTLYGAVAPWLTSPRDVRRLLNALAVSWRAVAADVDFADFVALETMRLFEPELYALVRLHGERLVGSGPNGGRDGRKEEESFAEGLLEAVRPERQEKAKEALCRLFPRLERAWRNRGYTGYFKQWDRERRACVERHFPTYFGFTVGSNALRKSEVDVALTDLQDTAAFRNRVTAYAETHLASGSNKAAVLLDELRTHVEYVPLDQIAAAANSIAAVADIFCDAADSGSFLSVPPPWRVWWVMGELLRRLKIEQRGQALEVAINGSSSFLLHSFTVRALVQAHGRDPEHHGEREVHPLADEAVLGKLQVALLDRLRSAAKDGSLLRQRQLISLLLHWSELASEDEVRTWTEEQLQTEAGVIVLCRAAVQTGRSHTDGDLVSREHITVDLDALAKVMNVDQLRTKLSELAARPDATASELLNRLQIATRNNGE
jgi:predicted KAP-like P-loop ATPase